MQKTKIFSVFFSAFNDTKLAVYQINSCFCETFFKMINEFIQYFPHKEKSDV